MDGQQQGAMIAFFVPAGNKLTQLTSGAGLMPQPTRDHRRTAYHQTIPPGSLLTAT